MAHLPGLAQRLERAEVDVKSVTGVKQFLLGWQPRAGADELRIGDHAAMIPPFTGNGMSMAFQSALDAVEPLATASFNGAELQRLGLQPGDAVTVSSRRGTVSLHARRDDGTPDGTVFIPFAYAEAAANRLTNPALDPQAKIPEFKYCAVRVQAGGVPVATAGYGTGVV